MFTYFTDRDGKFQLKSLAESGFDPLARTCRFMLTEEAHHMFVGETGVGRVVKRTLEVMKEIGSDDPQAVRDHGAIDLPTIQRYMNFWFTSSLDLFGSEVSSNAASSFANGIKGRPDEAQYQDHVCSERRYELETPQGKETVSLRNAMNEVMRNVLHQGLRDRRQALEHADPARGLRLSAGAAEPALPPLHRRLGERADRPARQADQPRGIRARLPDWIPSESDRAFVHEPDAARDRAGKDGRLDRPAGPRHQQPAGGLRVRETQLTEQRLVTSGSRYAEFI